VLGKRQLQDKSGVGVEGMSVTSSGKHVLLVDPPSRNSVAIHDDNSITAASQSMFL
jgi:hypothetical protein